MSGKIKFAHLADLHLGSFREKKLTALNFKTFERAISKILEEEVKFVLFSGDIFNNAMPQIEIVIKFTSLISKLRDKGIKVYVIGGSHDYSLSGKSYIQLLDEAGVLVDVCKFEKVGSNKIDLKFTCDDDLKVCVCGVLGKKNGLDKNIYANLNKQNLREDYLNIFMFHATLNDFKPASLNVKSEVDTSFLPKGFDYYAGGHIHKPMVKSFENGSVISYSGALFPNNFRELCFEEPSFNLCEYDFDRKKLDVKKVVLKTYENEYVKIELKENNPVEARKIIEEELEEIDVSNRIVLLEVFGSIDGKVSDVGLNVVVSNLYERGALQVLKNTYKLKSLLVDTLEESVNLDAKEVEEQIVRESLEGKESFDEDYKMMKRLLKLELIKQEGEKVSQFEERVVSEIEKVVSK